MTVKIAAALPKETSRNAFLSRGVGEWKNGTDDLVAVAFLRPRSAKQMLGGFEGDSVLELAVVRVEVLDGVAREVATAMLFEANATRTGFAPLGPIVGPFTAPCEACEETGSETAYFDEEEWTRDCRACGGAGQLTFDVGDVGHALIAALTGRPWEDDEFPEEAA